MDRLAGREMGNFRYFFAESGSLGIPAAQFGPGEPSLLVDVLPAPQGEAGDHFPAAAVRVLPTV